MKERKRRSVLQSARADGDGMRSVIGDFARQIHVKSRTMCLFHPRLQTQLMPEIVGFGTIQDVSVCFITIHGDVDKVNGKRMFYYSWKRKISDQQHSSETTRSYAAKLVRKMRKRWKGGFVWPP